MKIRIGTRKSALALIQTNIIIQEISKILPNAECIIQPITTTGDEITDRNLYDIGGKALFLKEIETELVNNNIDIAVHSLKDVPGILPKTLTLAATLVRSDPRDCFISTKYQNLHEIPQNGIIGTSSMRRKVIVQQERPDLKIVEFRGNIETRINKIQDNIVDASFLACAGLMRANLFDPTYCFPIETNHMLPAAGQGIIAIEIRKNDQMMQKLCKQINHIPTWHIAKAERSFLSYLNADCNTPLSAYAVWKDKQIEARYMLSTPSGESIAYHTETSDADSASMMGIKAAKILRAAISNDKQA